MHGGAAHQQCNATSARASLAHVQILTAGTFTSTVIGWDAPLPLPLLMVVL